MLLQATLENESRQFSPTLSLESLRRVPKSFALKPAQNSLLISLKPKLLDLRSRPSQFDEEFNETEDEKLMRRKREKASIDSSLDFLRKRIVSTTSDEKSRRYATQAVERR